MWKLKLKIYGTLTFLTVITSYNLYQWYRMSLNSEAPAFIAHAGGGITGLTHTNSLEALNLNYDHGFRYFEIDLDWTHDGKLVLIRDWDQTYARHFEPTQDRAPANLIPTIEEFQRLKMTQNLTPLTLDRAMTWLSQHPDAHFITDVKQGNLKALKIIRKRHHDLQERIVPQTYQSKEILSIRKLGYHRVILSLFQMKIDKATILKVAKSRRPFAVSTWGRVALQTGLAQDLSQIEIPLLARTVNDKQEYEALLAAGVTGIYTDFLSPRMER